MANTLDQAEALFYAGRMNKDYDERLIPTGEYIDALNIRVGSTELGGITNSELGSIGALENSRGNTALTDLQYVNGNTKCIGAFEDGANETIYWFVTSVEYDAIVSYNTTNNTETYHVVSSSVLNFNSEYLINGINKVDDLLFWTDNLNPPRKINVKSKYPFDAIDESDISVIVAPPISSPTVVLRNTPGGENYMLDKFISFSYRYRYKDGEYSALSQFTDIAFEPGEFEIDYSNFLNVGMTNSFNSVTIGFETGPKNVVAIDVCFKLSNSNIINVIEKFNKKKQGWSDNVTQSLNFTNRKIYTTLLESELLRLYDNVPRTAKAQTSIGNRIMYGNYVDGYDIEIPSDYSLEAISTPVSDNELSVTYSSGIPYTIDTTKTVSNSAIDIDFTGYELKNGYVLTIEFNIESDSYSGSAAFNDPPDSPGPGSQNDFSYTFSYLLQQDFDNVLQLANSQDFIDAISTHKPYADASSGFSLTDLFNADKVGKPADPPYGVWNDIDSGITGVNGSFRIHASAGSNILSIQCPAVKFSTFFSGSTLYGYQYFNNSITNVYYNKLGAKRSLHSNRDYEVAIVYMDDYLRSSTALVDTNNTVFFGADKSVSINNVRVTLSSLPPSWATKYKFVLKQSVSSYETVYTNMFFLDGLGNTWFKLDGDNRSKVKEDQILIVKKDTNGAVSSLVNTTVLELVTQPENFIKNNQNDSGEEIIEPAGLYMRLRPSDFSAEYDPNSFRDKGVNKANGYTSCYFDELNPLYNPDDAISETNRYYRPFAVPAGSIITFSLYVHRDRRGNFCDDYTYRYKKIFTSNNDYSNMYEWFNGQGVDVTQGDYSGGETVHPTPNQLFDFRAWPGLVAPYETGNFNDYYFWAAQNALGGDTNINQYGLDYEQGRLKFTATTGMPNCISPVNSKYTSVSLHVTVQTGSGNLIFETEPELSNGEIYFENSQSFDITDGYHMSGLSDNDQNQTGSVPAIIDLDFFNCFTFGNGAESYKINDSLTGAPFYLGSRVTAVSQEDFKEADRYASITYSGIYNADTNINKLNEFNLGLANWKDCEKSFGPINILHGRKTDVLVLQEDKVSNVLVGKNLISDAAGGGAITSNPEVLGTQIARIEEYGISNNPESFVVYGYDSYFTDAKRNVVLNLKGEDLIPISSYRMSNWFRSKFKDSISSQNIGGYDPYMNEYVISLKDSPLPSDPIVYDCGTPISQYSTEVVLNKFNVELGDVTGNVVFDYNFTYGEATIVVKYDGVEVINDLINGLGSVFFYKGTIGPSFVEVSLYLEYATYTLLVNCPVEPEITVVSVVINSPYYAGQTVHNSYNWSLDSYTSPTATDFITMNQNGVSLYNANTGMSSNGVIPAIGSTVKMISNKQTGDTITGGITNFKYLVSDTLYTENDINSLKPELSTATPLLNPSVGNYESSFVYNNPDVLQYLYLVWDYTISAEMDEAFAYGGESILTACNI